MPRPTARVLALLEILQSGGTRPVADLAARLGVDERTVRRYVAHLLELDVPVESVRGRYGGYRLGPGYRLPPLMLTGDEAVAVLVGLESRAQDGAGVSRTAAESAATKIRRVLTAPLARQLGALRETAHFPGRSPGSETESDVLLLVAEAARARRTLEIVHASRTGRVTERTVQPYGLVAHAGHWYLTGRDSLAQAVRTFRLDRVTAAELGSVIFEVPADFRPQDEVLRALAKTPWHHRVSVKVRADPHAIRSRLPLGLAAITPLTDEGGWTRIEIRAEQLHWVPGVLATLDADLIIEGPEELRGRVLTLAQRLLAACSDGADRSREISVAAHDHGATPG